MSQQLKLSAHLVEIFTPYRHDEKRMLAVLERALALGCYSNAEITTFQDAEDRRRVRSLLEKNHVTALTYVTPYVGERGLSLCDLDEGGRRAALGLVKLHAELAADAGCNRFGIPSGNYPGDAKKDDAMKRMTDSMVEIAEYCQTLGMDVTIEPCDRYTYKKQLIGPIAEVTEWIGKIRETCPNVYLHWDCAHAALAGEDLIESLRIAAPYTAQIHLCDAILDPENPFFGDLHKDVARAPEWETEGILTPEAGAAILKEAVSLDKPSTLKTDVHVSVEVMGHPGDDLWLKEENARKYILHAAELAGVVLH